MTKPGPPDCHPLLGERGRPLMDAVYEGLASRRKLFLRAPAFLPDAFVLHPYFLSHLAGEMRLCGYLSEQEQLADFPVSLLTEARCLPDRFEDALATEPTVRHGQGWIRSGSRHRVCLRFKASSGWARGLKICAGQSVEAVRDHLLIRFSTDDLGAVQRFAKALGNSVTVEEPGVLRSLLRSYLDGAQLSYSPLPQDFKRAPSS